MSKWEYRRVFLSYHEVRDATSPHFDAKMQQAGDDGWELVHVVDAGKVESGTIIQGYFFLFKRPKSE
jgi:hypothetical protein